MNRSPLLLALLALAVAAGPSQSRAASDSRGTDFWLMFDANIGTPTLTLFIAGETATTGTVEIPGLAFSTAFTVSPGAVTSVGLPSAAQVSTSDVVGNLGIHVTSLQEVTVYGLNRIQYTTDAYLGLPVDILGTEYFILGYPVTLSALATEFGIVATADATTVTITPSVTTGGRAANVPYTITMNQGQTYQLQNGTLGADLSGTLVSSSKPVAVYGGNQCTDIPLGAVACDHVVEQLTPTSTWGKQFVTMPLATRVLGDTFRFVASTSGTVLRVNGVAVATLGRGQVHERIITGPSLIQATEPVMVAQYSNSTSYDGITSDPFMMLVPPFEQFLAEYTVTTPASGFTINYVNVVAPTTAAGLVTLDGVAIPAASFTAIPGSTFSGAQVPVSLGSHHLSSLYPFGVFVYGFASYDSYGYPGGMSLAPVATVTTLALLPPSGTAAVGTLHCVTAGVTDQFGAAVPGVRVDFAVAGANPSSSFQVANAAGNAEFCYTGANPGDDTIVASVGTVTANAAMTWTQLADSIPPACAITAVVAGPPKQLQITVQDTGRGLQSILVTMSVNASTPVPAFTPGTKDPVVVTATKIDQGSGAQIALQVTDLAGNVTNCDPLVAGEVSAAPPPAPFGCSHGPAGVDGLLLLAVAGFFWRRRFSN